MCDSKLIYNELFSYVKYGLTQQLYLLVFDFNNIEKTYCLFSSNCNGE